LNYDPESGNFFWIKANYKRPDLVGKLAGTPCTGVNLYVKIQLKSRQYQAHRLAWLYMTGEFPKDMLDHIDGDKSNNRYANLRQATCSQNMMNVKKSILNTSGVKGVVWDSTRGKWRAYYNLNKKVKTIGRFKKMEDAVKARRDCVKKHYGEFANEL
jgi:hypothetical protein